jgi:hypothetical protein
MKRGRLVGSFIILVILFVIFNSCSHKKGPLDPNKPITISVWHYYNGAVKSRFDALVAKFNDTVGAEQGVVMEAQSYGDVNELADAVFRAAKKSIGAQPMPDIFAAYPDNAFRVDKVSELVDMEAYFSKEELSTIRKEFLEEGRFGKEPKLKILPIAKSTENLYLNKTYWDQFAAKTGAKIENLSTWEGIRKTAELYYHHTGKAFFSIDSNANFILSASKQLGEELYTYNADKAELNLSEDKAYKIWENFYVPYIQGYYEKTGRFSSDDAKTGKIIAYTGSTAGASYFPTEVAEGNNSIPVEVLTLPYPCFEDGDRCAIQQGAGMCITKSDEAHEYGAALFLKWFIAEPQNIQFSVATAYFPVKVTALKAEILLNEVKKENISVKAIESSISTTMDMFNRYKFYGNRPFEGSYQIRSLLENNLFDYMQKDLQFLKDRVKLGQDRNAVESELISKENFQKWYRQFQEKASQILSN